MKECWINVYPECIGGNRWKTREAAIQASNYDSRLGYNHPIYRIHVKMKPVKSIEHRVKIDVEKRWMER